MTRSALIVCNNRGMVLIEHPLGRSRKPGNWDLPKGHYDSTSDGSALDVALRECEEETGLIFDKDEADFLCVTDYGPDTLYVFFVNHPVDINIEYLHCSSKIEGCSQQWKNGLPEVDAYNLVSLNELDQWVFKKFAVNQIKLALKSQM